MTFRIERGPVAQLGARFNGIEEVTGSNPVRSTKPFAAEIPSAWYVPFFLFFMDCTYNACR
jgi:hypothetical protein